MTSRAYYNEIDPYAAQWLRNLIAAGHIAPGDVDERSIEDVNPDDLRGYTQCHFFAGIGVWSRALRLAGWPDSRPVWTGSCPCQPFSAAGKGGGFDDERHLWPAFHHLISQRRPPVVFGEQVASKDGLAWLDLVQTDLEGADYAAAAVDLCAAGVGAPHIRQRLWWVALSRIHNTASARLFSAGKGPEDQARNETWMRGPERRRAINGDSGPGASRLADSDGGDTGAERQQRSGQHGQQQENSGVAQLGHPERSLGQRRPNTSGLDGDHTAQRNEGASDNQPCGGVGRLADAGRPVNERVCRSGEAPRAAGAPEVEAQQREWSRAAAGSSCSPSGVEDRRHASPTNGQWRDADWLFCRDGKWRPVEPGTFPLAHGATARVGRLRAYGNAIVPQVAAEVINAYMWAVAEAVMAEMT